MKYELRCKNCNKKLSEIKGTFTEISIKCTRTGKGSKCGVVNIFNDKDKIAKSD